MFLHFFVLPTPTDDNNHTHTHQLDACRGRRARRESSWQGPRRRCGKGRRAGEERSCSAADAQAVSRTGGSGSYRYVGSSTLLCLCLGFMVRGYRRMRSVASALNRPSSLPSEHNQWVSQMRLYCGTGHMAGICSEELGLTQAMITRKVGGRQGIEAVFVLPFCCTPKNHEIVQPPNTNSPHIAAVRLSLLFRPFSQRIGSVSIDISRPSPEKKSVEVCVTV